jgi:hypothetical protein
MNFNALYIFFRYIVPNYFKNLLKRLKMAKRKKKDLELNIDTKNIDIKISRKDGKFKAEIDTPIIDAQITKDEENGLDVDVTVDEKAPKVLGNIIARIIRKARG